jgi:hypothetical protein
MPLRNCKFKTRRYHDIPIRRIKSQTLTTPNAGPDVKHQEHSFTAGANAK